MTQADLFGAPPIAEQYPGRRLPRHVEAPRAAPPPPIEAPIAGPPSRPDPFPVPAAWTHLLGRVRYPDPVIVVSALYTEQVLECLADAAGQHTLWRDGRITTAPPADWPPRRRFLTAAEARALHRTHPLVVIEWPLPQTVHLRLARWGDATLADLPLPPFHEH